MTKYIPLDALVAEIERLENKLYYEPENFKDVGAKIALDSLKSSLDTLKAKEVGVDLGDPKGDKSVKCIIDTKTLEVKEVDLEKELDSMITPELKFHKALPSLFDVAKHFFELGFMHTLSWKDIRLIAEIGEEFMCSEESDVYTDEENYYNAILNKLKEKGLDYKTQRQEIRDIKAQKGE